MSEEWVEAAARVVGRETVDRLREAGFAVVPFDVPDAAVGELMTWVGCSDPNLAWEGVNCAINLVAAPKPDDNPAYLENMRRLGSGEMTLEEWRALCHSTPGHEDTPTS